MGKYDDIPVDDNFMVVGYDVGGAYTTAHEEEEEGNIFTDTARDLGIGTASIGESIAGIGDWAVSPVRSKGGETFTQHFRESDIGQWRDELKRGMSAERRASEAGLEAHMAKSDGSILSDFSHAVSGAVLYPRATFGKVVQALPAMALSGGAAGAVGKAALGRGASIAAARGAATTASGATEGLISGGQTANTVAEYNRQHGYEPTRGMSAPVVTAIGVGAIGKLGGGMEAGLFNKALRQEAKYTGAGAIPLTFVKEFGKEGSEETLQAPFETIPANVATDTRWDKDLGSNMGESLVTGGILGGTLGTATKKNLLGEANEETSAPPPSGKTPSTEGVDVADTSAEMHVAPNGVGAATNQMVKDAMAEADKAYAEEQTLTAPPAVGEDVPSQESTTNTSEPKSGDSIDAVQRHMTMWEGVTNKAPNKVSQADIAKDNDLLSVSPFAGNIATALSYGAVTAGATHLGISKLQTFAREAAEVSSNAEEAEAYLRAKAEEFAAKKGVENGIKSDLYAVAAAYVAGLPKEKGLQFVQGWRKSRHAPPLGPRATVEKIGVSQGATVVGNEHPSANNGEWVDVPAEWSPSQATYKTNWHPVESAANKAELVAIPKRGSKGAAIVGGAVKMTEADAVNRTPKRGAQTAGIRTGEMKAAEIDEAAKRQAEELARKKAEAAKMEKARQEDVQKRVAEAVKAERVASKPSKLQAKKNETPATQKGRRGVVDTWDKDGNWTPNAGQTVDPKDPRWANKVAKDPSAMRKDDARGLKNAPMWVKQTRQGAKEFFEEHGRWPTQEEYRTDIWPKLKKEHNWADDADDAKRKNGTAWSTPYFHDITIGNRAMPPKGVKEAKRQNVAGRGKAVEEAAKALEEAWNKLREEGKTTYDKPSEHDASVFLKAWKLKGNTPVTIGQLRAAYPDSMVKLKSKRERGDDNYRKGRLRSPFDEGHYQARNEVSDKADEASKPEAVRAEIDSEIAEMKGDSAQAKVSTVIEEKAKSTPKPEFIKWFKGLLGAISDFPLEGDGATRMDVLGAATGYLFKNTKLSSHDGKKFTDSESISVREALGRVFNNAGELFRGREKELDDLRTQILQSSSYAGKDLSELKTVEEEMEAEREAAGDSGTNDFAGLSKGEKLEGSLKDKAAQDDVGDDDVKDTGRGEAEQQVSAQVLPYFTGEEGEKLGKEIGEEVVSALVELGVLDEQAVADGDYYGAQERLTEDPELLEAFRQKCKEIWEKSRDGDKGRPGEPGYKSWRDRWVYGLDARAALSELYLALDDVLLAVDPEKEGNPIDIGVRELADAIENKRLAKVKAGARRATVDDGDTSRFTQASAEEIFEHDRTANLSDKGKALAKSSPVVMSGLKDKDTKRPLITGRLVPFSWLNGINSIEDVGFLSSAKRVWDAVRQFRALGLEFPSIGQFVDANVAPERAELLRWDDNVGSCGVTLGTKTDNRMGFFATFADGKTRYKTLNAPIIATRYGVAPKPHEANKAWPKAFVAEARELLDSRLLPHEMWHAFDKLANDTLSKAFSAKIKEKCEEELEWLTEIGAGFEHFAVAGKPEDASTVGAVDLNFKSDSGMPVSLPFSLSPAQAFALRNFLGYPTREAKASGYKSGVYEAELFAELMGFYTANPLVRRIIQECCPGINEAIQEVINAVRVRGYGQRVRETDKGVSSALRGGTDTSPRGGGTEMAEPTGAGSEELSSRTNAQPSRGDDGGVVGGKTKEKTPGFHESDNHRGGVHSPYSHAPDRVHDGQVPGSLHSAGVSGGIGRVYLGGSESPRNEGRQDVAVHGNSGGGKPPSNNDRRGDQPEVPGTNRETPRGPRTQKGRKLSLADQVRGKLIDAYDAGKNKVFLGLLFTRDLVNWATKDVPDVQAFKRWHELLERQAAFRNDWQAGVASVKEHFDKLPPAVRNTVDELLNDIAIEEVWPYHDEDAFTDKGWETYVSNLKDDRLRVYRDLSDRFNNLPEKAQAVVREALNHGVVSRKTRAQMMRDLIVERYAALLDTATDSKTAEQIKKDRDSWLKKYEKLDGAVTRPYMPLRRFGDHVVVAKSRDYEFVEKSAGELYKTLQKRYNGNPTPKQMSPYNKLRTRLQEMQADPDHYKVIFVDGAGTAKARAESLKKENPNYIVAHFARSEHVGGSVPSWQKLEQVMTSAMEAMKAENIVADPKSTRHTQAALSEIFESAQRMYLEALEDDNARKSELKRMKVAGYHSKMMENFAEAGRAEANLFSNISYGAKVRKVLVDMQTEVRHSSNRTAGADYMNEVFRRHNQMLTGREDGKAVNALLRTNSFVMLMTSPAYYLQNLLQPLMMSAPYMAGNHGMSASVAAITRTMSQAAKAVRHGTTIDEIADGMKLNDEERMALRKARDLGHIDIGMASDFGRITYTEENPLKTKVVGVTEKLVDISRQVEMVNRIGTFLAAYRLERARIGKAKNAPNIAWEYADRVVYKTHGDYSGINAPRLFAMNSFTKIATQFRKFQLIQAGMMLGLAKRAFLNATPAEKAIARRQLAWTMGIHFAMAGAKGTPFITTLLYAMGVVFGGGDDDDDMIRDYIKDKETADLLLNGIPKWLGIDMSQKVGAGNMFSAFPFMDTKPQDGEDFWKDLVVSLMGPTGSLGERAFRAVQYGSQGDYYKGVEAIAPTGVGNVMKAFRFGTEGVTTRAGDVHIPGEDFTFMELVAQAAGLPPNKITDRNRVMGSLIRHEDWYDKEQTQINHDYKEAFKNRDTRGMMEARKRHRELNQRRREEGFKIVPMSRLTRTATDQRKRELKGQSIGSTVGVKPSNRRFIEDQLKK